MMTVKKKDVPDSNTRQFAEVTIVDPQRCCVRRLRTQLSRYEQNERNDLKGKESLLHLDLQW